MIERILDRTLVMRLIILIVQNAQIELSTAPFPLPANRIWLFGSLTAYYHTHFPTTFAQLAPSFFQNPTWLVDVEYPGQHGADAVQRVYAILWLRQTRCQSTQFSILGNSVYLPVLTERQWADNYNDNNNNNNFTHNVICFIYTDFWNSVQMLEVRY